MIHTKDGSRIGILCIKHGSAKVCFSLSYTILKKTRVVPILLLDVLPLINSFFFLLLTHVLFQERKKIIKGMKDHVRKIAEDKFGTMVSIAT